MANSIEISAHVDVGEISRKLSDLAKKQIPFATALALTRTAQLVKKGTLDVMRARLDRPTPITMSSVFVKPATKARLEARVWFKDSWSSGIPADRYMQPAVLGGARRHKRFEKALISRQIMKPNQYAVPAKEFLNQYGNITGGLAKKVLSGLGAAEMTSGYKANATNSRRSRRKGNADRFFVLHGLDRSSGIWERKATRWGDAIRPVFLFVDAPYYKVRIPFEKIAANIVKAHLQREFEQAMTKALATAK
ncbi:hypothetical protein ACFOJE_21240 [Azotobacter bryophylli]|uniref:Phage protein, HK97 gp10 family n=1 Tax=Azotobacter bryophylli TaxID=1986537 RepID=A0ABV7B0Q6_9GAMM